MSEPQPSPIDNKFEAKDNEAPFLPRGAQLREGMIININRTLKYRVTKIMPRGRVMMKEV